MGMGTNIYVFIMSLLPTLIILAGIGPGDEAGMRLMLHAYINITFGVGPGNVANATCLSTLNNMVGPAGNVANTEIC